MKYKKKPVVIDAIQWTGGNRQDIADFCGADVLTPIEAYKPFQVGTLEGQHTASLGDWIIRGVKGEHYPCKPDIFEATYHPDLVGGIVWEECELNWINERITLAIFAEREACATLAEETAAGRDAEAIADAIRMRSNG